MLEYISRINQNTAIWETVMVENDTGEIPFEYYLDLARAAPKIPVEDERVQEYLRTGDATLRNHDQFLNNFYMFWQYVTSERQSERGSFYGYDSLVAQTEGWTEFVDQNGDLIDRIKDALRQREPASTLFSKYLDLLNERKLDQIKQLEEATGHPLGLAATMHYAWDRLNPVLEEAAQKMQAMGIDPRPFAR